MRVGGAVVVVREMLGLRKARVLVERVECFCELTVWSVKGMVCVCMVVVRASPTGGAGGCGVGDVVRVWVGLRSCRPRLVRRAMLTLLMLEWWML